MFFDETQNRDSKSSMQSSVSMQGRMGKACWARTREQPGVQNRLQSHNGASMVLELLRRRCVGTEGFGQELVVEAQNVLS